VARPVGELCVWCASVKNAPQVVCGSIPTVSHAVSSRCLPHRRISRGLSKNLGEGLGDRFSVSLDRKPQAGARGDRQCRPTAVVMIGMPRRPYSSAEHRTPRLETGGNRVESSGRSPQIVGSRDACGRIQAPAETDEPGRDSDWARERRLRRRIACAGGSRRRRDSEGRHSLPFDPDEAEPKRRPFAVPLLRGWE
jgi:hypothetical protein